MTDRIRNMLSMISSVLMIVGMIVAAVVWIYNTSASQASTIMLDKMTAMQESLAEVRTDVGKLKETVTNIRIDQAKLRQMLAKGEPQ